MWKELGWDFFLEHKLTFLMYGLIIVLIFPLEAVFLPEIYGQMFDKLKSLNSFPSMFDFIKNMKARNVAGLMGILIITWIIIIGSGAIKYFFESKLVPEYLKFIRNIIYEKTIETYIEDYSDLKTGDYMSRVMELSRNFKDLFQMGLTRVIPEFIVSLIITGYLFYKNKKIGILTGIVFIVCMVIQYFGLKHLVKLIAEKEQFFNTELSENLTDSLENLMNIYINNEMDSQVKNNEKLKEINNQYMKRVMNAETLIIYGTQFLILLGYGLCIYLLYGMMKKKVNVKVGIVLILILGQFINYYMWVNSAFVHQIIYKLGIIEGSREYLDKLFTENKKAKTDVIHEGNISLQNVGFKHNKLKNII